MHQLQQKLTLLLAWFNRVDEMLCCFGGTDQQLPLTRQKKGNALITGHLHKKSVAGKRLPLRRWNQQVGAAH